MRRIVLVLVSLAAMVAACRTTQPPGTEDQVPSGTVGTEREPIQTVPSEEGGPAEPLPDAPDGGVPPEPD